MALVAMSRNPGPGVSGCETSLLSTCLLIVRSLCDTVISGVSLQSVHPVYTHGELFYEPQTLIIHVCEISRLIYPKKSALHGDLTSVDYRL
jgi:hypothetical protein